MKMYASLLPWLVKKYCSSKYVIATNKKKEASCRKPTHVLLQKNPTFLLGIESSEL